jgi:hypothetical protein
MRYIPGFAEANLPSLRASDHREVVTIGRERHRIPDERIARSGGEDDRL